MKSGLVAIVALASTFPAWSADARFASNPQRVANRDELVELMRGVTVTRTTSAWVSAMDAASVPCGPINSVERVFEDPQVQSRGMRVEMDHPLGGVVPLVANPIRLSATPVAYRHAPPVLGQHTDEVLQSWLGIDSSELVALRARRAV